jgi:hypothetical protein
VWIQNGWPKWVLARRLAQVPAWLQASLRFGAGKLAAHGDRSIDLSGRSPRSAPIPAVILRRWRYVREKRICCHRAAPLNACPSLPAKVRNTALTKQATILLCRARTSHSAILKQAHFLSRLRQPSIQLSRSKPLSSAVWLEPSTQRSLLKLQRFPSFEFLDLAASYHPHPKTSSHYFLVSDDSHSLHYRPHLVGA